MRVLLVAGLLAVTACTLPGGSATTTTSVPDVTVSTEPTPTTLPNGGCPQSVDFVEQGEILRRDRIESDTTTIGRISWGEVDGCERFEVEFQTLEGAPATTAPPLTVEFSITRQIIRVATSASSTIVTDQLVESEFVDRIYVVRALGGGLFIDIHLSTPVQALARVTNSPAGLTLEMQAGLLPFEGSASVSDRAVVVQPPDNEELGTSVNVAGYARTNEGNVLIIATAGDSVVAVTTAVAADWNMTWGEFATTIEVPAGDTSLFVGEEDPLDGSLAGVTVRMRNR